REPPTPPLFKFASSARKEIRRIRCFPARSYRRAQAPSSAFRVDPSLAHLIFSALSMHATLIASVAVFALNLATTVIDPAQDPQGAARSLVSGPAPAGYEPLMRAQTG